MSDIVPQFGLILMLIIVNAAFAGTAPAPVSLRERQLRRLENRSATAATRARLARQPNKFLATIQIGLTLAGSRGFAPKRVVTQTAQRSGMVMASPMAALSKVTRPVVWLPWHATDAAAPVIAANPKQQREQVIDEERATVRREPDGTVALPGSSPIHDLAEVGVDLPDGEYSTVAGLVLDSLGRSPAVGDVLTGAAWQIEARAVNRHRITKIAVKPLPTESDPGCAPIATMLDDDGRTG